MNWKTIKRIIMSLVVAALLGAVASSALSEPESDNVLVAGDGPTVQAELSEASFVVDATTHGTTGITSTVAQESQDIHTAVWNPEDNPQCVVIAFGNEEARDGVWSNEERNGWFYSTFTAQPSDTVVLVKPYHASPNPAIEDIRDGVDRLAEARNDFGYATNVVDWADIASEHPGYLEDDGIHLRAGTDAAQAYSDLLESGC